MTQPGGRAAAPVHLRLAQDLPNTVDLERGQDSLLTVGDLQRFALTHGVEGRFVSSDLDTFRELREAIRRVCTAEDTSGDLTSLAYLNDLLLGVPIALRVDSSMRLTLEVEPMSGAAGLLAQLATGLITAHELGDWGRLKACSAPSCRWIFYDRSPANRSRWCTMDLCGSREKVRAYRARTRNRGTIRAS